MITKIKGKAKDWLLWSQKYLNVDMMYLTKGGFWISATFIMSSILVLVQVIIFGNFLPKEVYGTYKYILSLSSIFAFLTLTGMNTAVTQATAKTGSSSILPYSIKIQLRWNLIFSAVIASISAYYFFNNNLIIAKSLFVLAFSFPLATTFNTYGAFLVGIKDFKRSSVYGLITSMIQTSSLTVTAILTVDVFTLIVVYALTSFIMNIFFYFKTVRIYKPGLIEATEKQQILKFSEQLTLLHALSGIAQHVDKIIIFHYLGAVELAVYGLALAIPERIRGYLKTLGEMIMPKLASKTINEIDTAFNTRTVQGIFIGALISGVYILCAPLFYKIFLPNYLEAIFYSQIFSLTLIFIIPSVYMSGVFSSHKMVRTMYYSSLSVNIIRISLFIILGRSFGIWGIITTILIMHFWGTIYNIYLWKIEVRKQRV